MNILPSIARDRRTVFVAAAGKRDDDDLVLAHLRRQTHRMVYRMRRFDGRNDALCARQILEGRDCLIITYPDIFGPADIMEPCVLRADAGIIQSGRDRIDRCDLSIFILTEIGFHAMKDPQAPGVHGRGGPRRIDALASRLTADEPHLLIFDEMIKTADSI